MAPGPASWWRKTPSWQCGPIGQSSACAPRHAHSHPVHIPIPYLTQPVPISTLYHLQLIYIPTPYSALCHTHPGAVPDPTLYPSLSPRHTILNPSPPHSHPISSPTHPHPIPTLILYPSHPCTHPFAVPIPMLYPSPRCTHLHLIPIPMPYPAPTPHHTHTHPVPIPTLYSSPYRTHSHPVPILSPYSYPPHTHPHPSPSPSPHRTQRSTPWPRSSAAGLPGGRSLMELLQIHARRPPGLCRPRSEHRGVRQRLPARGVPRTPDPTRSGCACGGESRSGRVFEQRPFLRGWVPRGGMGGGSDPLVVRRVPSSRLGSGGAGSDALLQPRHPLRALRNGHRTGAGTLTLSFAARRRGSADAHPPGDGGRGGRFAFGARRGRPSRLRRGEGCGGTPCPAAPCGRFPAVLQLCSQVSPRRLFPLRQLLRG